MIHICPSGVALGCNRRRWMAVCMWLAMACLPPALVCAPSLALGQADASQRALAIQLFDEGDRLMQAGDYAAACPKLAESHRLDPQLGALLYLAECYEENGRLASAWGSYRQAEELALKRGDARAGQAGERARALEPRLSRLVFELAPGPRPRGYQLARNDLIIAPALWDTAIAVDNGRYQIVATAPGYEPWSASVEVLGAGQRVVVRVPALVPTPRPAPAAAGAAVESSVVVESGSVGSSQRIAALAVGGLGLAGLGVGGFFALSARSAFSDSEPHCGDTGFCTLRGTQLREDALTDGLVATVSTAVGGLAVATAAVLWFTAPDGTEAETEADRGPSWQLAGGPGGIRVRVAGDF